MNLQEIMQHCNLEHWLVKCKGAHMLKLEEKLVLAERLRELGFDSSQLQPLQANVNGRVRQLTQVSDPARDADGQLHFSAMWQNGVQHPERVFWHELTKSTQSRVTMGSASFVMHVWYRLPNSF
jgi:hypothetical protein